MTRQRLRLRTPALAYLVRLMTAIFATALVWYGLMIILLAVKVAPHTVNAISDYRTLFRDLIGIRRGQFTTRVRLIAGIGGFFAFLLLVYLAVQELPRPYLARGPLNLRSGAQGRVTVRARAVERLAEIAASDNLAVTSSAGRLGDAELHVAIETTRARLATDTLADVQRRIQEALREHELTTLPVNVTLTGYDRKTKRELV